MTGAEVATDQLDGAALALLSPDTYVDEQSVHRAARLLRELSPVHYTHHPDYRPLWILTRYHDIHDIESHNKEWGQGGHPFLRTHQIRERTIRGAVQRVRMLIDYDGDEHRAYRGVTQKWFTPRRLAGLEGRVAELARRSVDKMASLGNHCDFAQDIAVNFPLETILSILGIPEADYSYMLKLSQQMLNSDPDSDSAYLTENEQRELMISLASDVWTSGL